MSGERNAMRSGLSTGRATWPTRWILAAAMPLALVAVGCSSSPPTQFYTLSDTASEAAAPAGVGLVQIVGVSIPGELDRPEMVREIGPNQLAISGLHRWAAPLDQMIRRVLSDDIARRVPAPVQGQQYPVSVDIREFYGDNSCNVTLRAAWSVRQPHTAAMQPANEDISVPSGGACPATLATTMSTAIGQLSDRIVAGVARLPPPAPTPAATKK